MRLRLKLKFTSSKLISANYHYALSSAIYKLLHFGSPQFANFLHNKGFNNLRGKPYKLFTFSLKFKNIKIFNDVFHINSDYVDLYISSPINDEFIKNFLIGTFSAKKFDITANNTLSIFSIEQAEYIPEPVFMHKTKFLMNSPLVLSKNSILNNKSVEYYYRYNDNIEELNMNFNNNLKNKYELIMNRKYLGDGVKLKWDDEYIKTCIARGKQIKKRVIITRDINNPISIIGIQTPFYLEGDKKLMKVGYECGFGKNNSMGFGMAEVIK